MGRGIFLWVLSGWRRVCGGVWVGGGAAFWKRTRGGGGEGGGWVVTKLGN